eukprot:4077112-Heterocapsa_arctica.AAC.1
MSVRYLRGTQRRRSSSPFKLSWMRSKATPSRSANTAVRRTRYSRNGFAPTDATPDNDMSKWPISRRILGDLRDHAAKRRHSLVW